MARLLSDATAFGLGREEGLAIVEEIQGKIRGQWQDIADAAGFADAALRLLEPNFRPIPLHEPERGEKAAKSAPRVSGSSSGLAEINPSGFPKSHRDIWRTLSRYWSRGSPQALFGRRWRDGMV